MKKFFTLIAAMAATVCASAEVTFDVALSGNQLTVTPSDASAEYYYCAVPQSIVDGYWAWMGISVDTPDLLFQSALNVFFESPMTGVQTETLEPGAYSFVVAPIVMEGGEYVASQAAVAFAFNTEEGLPGGNEPGDDPVVADLTFDFASAGSSFTLTPSVDDAPYYLWVFSAEEMDECAEAGYTNDELLAVNAAFAHESDLLTGTNTITADEWYLDEEGQYFVLVAGVKYNAEGDIYELTTPVATFEWNYTEGGTVAIEQVNAAASRVAKAMQQGRIVLGSRYGINGVEVR